MKTTDAYSLHFVGGDFLDFFDFTFHSPTRCSPIEDWVLRWWWQPDQLRAPRSPRAWWQQWLPRHVAGNPAPHGDFWAITLPDPGGGQFLCRLILAPQCRCCGATHSIRLVEDAENPIDRQWRCEKHLARLPCIIEGCGVTAAMKPDWGAGDDLICGKHWRMAPKFMRDAVARVRRKGKKFGWNGRLHRRYNRLWHRTVRAVAEGQHIDMAEIERQFGGLS